MSVKLSMMKKLVVEFAAGTFVAKSIRSLAIRTDFLRLLSVTAVNVWAGMFESTLLKVVVLLVVA